VQQTRSLPTNATTKSSSRGCAPRSFGRPTKPRTPSRAGGSQKSSSPRCRPVRSRRSSGLGRPSGSGARRSWPTSTPAAHPRRHRGHQRPHRTPPPHRPRLHQPRQLPTQNAPHRRRPTPHPTVKSRISRHGEQDEPVQPEHRRCRATVSLHLGPPSSRVHTPRIVRPQGPDHGLHRRPCRDPATTLS
jgi:hypothetical protein